MSCMLMRHQPAASAYKIPASRRVFIFSLLTVMRGIFNFLRTIDYYNVDSTECDILGWYLSMECLVIELRWDALCILQRTIYRVSLPIPRLFLYREVIELRWDALCILQRTIYRVSLPIPRLFLYRESFLYWEAFNQDFQLRLMLN